MKARTCSFSLPAKSALCLVLIAVLSVPYSALSEAASGPLAVIRSGTDRALDILRSAHSGTGPKISERRGEILIIVDEYFNFREMAKRALGAPWKDQPQEKQREFVVLFKELLFNTYVDRVEKYTGANEKVIYDQEIIEGDFAVVKTRVLNYKDADVQLDYRLRLEEGQWKVYDVIIEGISLVNNYRSQFNSLMASGSFDNLLKVLRDKTSQRKST